MNALLTGESYALDEELGDLKKKKKDVSEVPIVSSPPPSPRTLSAVFFPFLLFRSLMLPLTCTASMVCPPPETQVQLSMVTRSVYRQIL